jgi:molybdopterin converting factor subunit 1
MKLTVLYFAAVRELVATDEEQLEPPEHVTTIGALSRWLAETREPLRGRLGPVRFARNEELVGDDEPLADGDVVALIPPVAGG